MCAVFGIHGSADAAVLTLWGLHALQHRGQESCGIAVRQSEGIAVRRELGLAGKLLEEGHERFPGNAAIGHNRYSTAGTKHAGTVEALTNTHPFSAYFKYGPGKYGDIALVHNGNFTNADALRDELYAEGRVCRSRDSDTEVLLHLIGRAQGEVFAERLVQALRQVVGAYSLLILTDKKLVAVRDPQGTHPLVMGTLAGAYVFASETCALSIIGATYVRDVAPGEIVIVEGAAGPHSVLFAEPEPRPCIFEHVYTMFPGSMAGARTVYELRENIGRMLAREAPANADMVVAAPDSGNPYAFGYAAESGIPFGQGLLRNHYAVGRAFLEPTQALRNMKVRKKLSCSPIVRGQRVVLVDDSIVRGITARLTVEMLFEGGAREVHFRSAFPPFVGGCPSGTDVPTRAELVAGACKSIAEAERVVCEATGATSVRFFSVAGIHEALFVQPERACNGCVTRRWPIPRIDARYAAM